MKPQIKLGDKVRCVHTGFTGTAVAKTEFINKCIQWNVLPKGEKKNKMPEEMCIDQGSLEVILTKKPVKKKKPRERTGGPMRRGITQRGF